MTEHATHIDALIKRAGEANQPDEAMKFSQAALNVANAVSTLDYNARENAAEAKARSEVGATLD